MVSTSVKIRVGGQNNADLEQDREARQCWMTLRRPMATGSLIHKDTNGQRLRRHPTSFEWSSLIRA
jgi:hypothetical protein